MLIKNRIHFFDGLRGIAVLSVVLYHFYPGVFFGGYSGVDIFFMISGFLITKAIMKNHLNSNFDYYDFFYRRVTRIFPAFLFVIFSVFITGWFLLESLELKLMAQHSIYSILQIINFVLGSEGGYFDVSSEHKVFLHMWSLSVEWQIYIVAPFITLFMVRKFGLSSSASLILLALAIFGMVSFIYFSAQNPTAAYYSSLLRIWAYFFGMAICYFEYSDSEIKDKFTTMSPSIKMDTQIVSLFTYVVLPLIIIFNIIIIAKYFDSAYVSSVSVICASLMVVFRNKFNSIKSLYFVSKPLIWLGIISFSVYLWHWPVLYFSRILNWNQSIEASTLSLIIILILSLLSYSYIEKPFINIRNKKAGTIKLLFFAVALCLFATYIIKTDGAQNRYFAMIKNYPSFEYKGSGVPRGKCEAIEGVADSWCNSIYNSPEVLLLGDSHANHLKDHLYTSNHKIFSKLLNMGAGNCHAALREQDPRCYKQITETISRLGDFEGFKYAIFAGWNLTVTQNNVDQFKVGYTKIFDLLLSKGIQPIFIVDNPTLKISPDVCKAITSKIYLRRKITNSGSISICKNLRPTDFEENPPYYEDLVIFLQKKYVNVIFLNPFNAICKDKICSSFADGYNFLYNDKGHLSLFGSSKTVEYILKEIDKL